MKKINLDKLSEQDARNAITYFLQESGKLLAKNKYDESAGMLINAAKVVKSIPQIKRKEINRRSSKQKGVKDDSQDQDDVNTSNPFEV